MVAVAGLISFLFFVYTLMIFGRILGSWFPQAQNNQFMRFLVHYTDPYLNLFRRIIPPLGMIDLSPVVALLALQVAKWMILWLITR
jgi:YggT family protein